MNFFELLAVTEPKQQIDIMNVYGKVVESNSCLWLWECNTFYEELVESVEVKDNKLLVKLKNII